MLVTKDSQNSMKTARHLSRNPNIIHWPKGKNRETKRWLVNEFWLNIFFANWKCFVFWVKGTAIAERGLPCASIWSLRFITLNSTKTDFCKRSNISIAFYPDRNTFATPTETLPAQYRLPDIQFHDLRHTTASLLSEKMFILKQYPSFGVTR